MTRLDKTRQRTQLNLRCTEEEMARWKETAGAVPLATWVKSVLNAATGYRADAPTDETEAPVKAAQSAKPKRFF